MRKGTSGGLALVALVALSLTSAVAHGGSIDNLSNQSAEYLRSFNRNAATDSADIIFYNPAGTAFLPQDGLYLSFYSQTIFKTYTITYKGKDYVSDVPTPILPSLYIAFKRDWLAAFGAFNVVAGGGTLEYEDGVPYLIPLGIFVTDKTATEPTEGYFKGTSMALAGTIGAAVKPLAIFGASDMLSISAAVRIVSFEKEYEGWGVFGAPDATVPDTRAELKAQKKALGVGGVFGVHLRPFSMLDFGLRLETPTNLNFKTTSTTKNLTIQSGTALESYGDGFEEARDLPMVLSVGLQMNFLDRMITVGVNYTHYFINLADEAEDVGAVPGTATSGYYVKGYDDDYGDDKDLSVGVEVRPIEMLAVSAGYNRTFSSGNKDTLSDFEYVLSSHSIGFGGKLTLFERLDITLSFTTTLYDEGKNENMITNPTVAGILKTESETFNKRVYTLGVGLGYRLF